MCLPPLHDRQRAALVDAQDRKATQTAPPLLAPAHVPSPLHGGQRAASENARDRVPLQTTPAQPASAGVEEGAQPTPPDWDPMPNTGPNQQNIWPPDPGANFQCQAFYILRLQERGTRTIPGRSPRRRGGYLATFLAKTTRDSSAANGWLDFHLRRYA
uniref:Uncharacterized protein n=1 Tax=Rhizochromulina marina TaxID=1034831 RepID=A0A7S2W278_9STRA